MAKFGGKQLGAGRPSGIDESKRNRALNLSWDILVKRLENPRVKEEEKIEIALRLCPKTIPTQIGGIDGGDIRISIVNYNGNTNTAQLSAKEVPVAVIGSN